MSAQPGYQGYILTTAYYAVYSSIFRVIHGKAMSEQDRGDRGRFAAKGDVSRAVRSIRLTDTTWEALGEKADDHDMSRADYLEALAAGEVEWDSEGSESNHDFDPDEVAEILQDALVLKANAGGKIKARIKDALILMGFDPDEEQ